MADEYVLDVSAAVQALLPRDDSARELAYRLSEAEPHAPHPFDAEVGDVLRRRVLRGQLTARSAAAVVWSLETVVEQRYPHAGVLACQAWELRGRVRFYDALYIALAARLRVPVLTVGGKLSRIPDPPCAVEVVGPGNGAV